MADKRVQDMTDDELVDEAQTGMRGSGTIPEMLRRVAGATNRLTGWIIGLMVVQIILAGLALWRGWGCR